MPGRHTHKLWVEDAWLGPFTTDFHFYMKNWPGFTRLAQRLGCWCAAKADHLDLVAVVLAYSRGHVVWGCVRALGVGKASSCAETLRLRHTIEVCNIPVNIKRLVAYFKSRAFSVFDMADVWFNKDNNHKVDDQTKSPRDLITQSVISVAFGLIAFLTFCVSFSDVIRCRFKVLIR